MADNPFELYNKKQRRLFRRVTRGRNVDSIDEFSVSSEEVRGANPGQTLLQPKDRASLTAVFIVGLVVLSMLISRAFWLQLIAENNYRDLAEGNRVQEIVQKAPRGIIFDRAGQVLAKNNP